MTSLEERYDEVNYPLAGDRCPHLTGYRPDIVTIRRLRSSHVRSSGAKTITREITPQPFSDGQALVAAKLTRDCSTAIGVELMVTSIG